MEHSKKFCYEVSPMRFGHARKLALLGALFGSVACGSKGNVALIGRIDKPSLAVNRSAVGADVTGGFDLVLELGELASDATSVSLGAFSIERSGSELLSPLSLAGTTFPVLVGVGETKTIHLTLSQTPDLDVADKLCEADVSFRGSVTDTLVENRPTTLLSSAFTPSCPAP